MGWTSKNGRNSLLLWAVTSSVLARAEVGLMAEIGRPAAGFPAGYTYASVQSPVIGPAGHVAFGGSVAGGNDYTSALWAGKPGDLKVLIRENEPIAGLPSNVLFGSIPTSSANGEIVATRHGFVGFEASLKGDTFARGNAIANIDGVNKLIMRGGEQAPGFPPGVVSGSVDGFSLSDAGSVIVGTARDQNGNYRAALWYWDLDSITLIATTGMPLGNAFPDCSYSIVNFSGRAAAINDRGEVVFLAGLSGRGCPNEAILKWRNGVLQKVVAIGDAVPGMTNGTFMSGFFPTPIRINADGDVSFYATIRQPSPSTTLQSQWVARAGGPFQLLAVEGESLPGEPNEQFLALPQNALTATDGSSVISLFSTMRRYVIMAGRPRATQPYPGLPASGESQLRVVARIGQRPPGFGPTWFLEDFDDPSIGGSGFVGFSGVAADARDVSGTRTRAIWRFAEGGDTELMAKEGMEIRIGGRPATLEKIVGLNETLIGPGESSQSGFACQVSDSGQIIFRGGTSEASPGALFVTDVPEDFDTETVGQFPVPKWELCGLSFLFACLGLRGCRNSTNLRVPA